MHGPSPTRAVVSGDGRVFRKSASGGGVVVSAAVGMVGSARERQDTLVVVGLVDGDVRGNHRPAVFAR